MQQNHESANNDRKPDLRQSPDTATTSKSPTKVGQMTFRLPGNRIAAPRYSFGDWLASTHTCNCLDRSTGHSADSRKKSTIGAAMCVASTISEASIQRAISTRLPASTLINLVLPSFCTRRTDMMSSSFVLLDDIHVGCCIAVAMRSAIAPESWALTLLNFMLPSLRYSMQVIVGFVCIDYD